MTQIDVHANEPENEQTQEIKTPGNWKDYVAQMSLTDTLSFAGFLGLAGFLLWMYDWGKVVVLVTVAAGGFALIGLAIVALQIKRRQGDKHDS